MRNYISWESIACPIKTILAARILGARDKWDYTARFDEVKQPDYLLGLLHSISLTSAFPNLQLELQASLAN